MRVLSLRDIVDSTIVIILFPIAWLLPLRWWRPFTGWLGELHATVSKTSNPYLHRLIARELNAEAQTVEAQFRAENYRELLAYLREHHPFGWPVEIRVRGKHHVEAGLQRGKGVLLWVTPFTHCSLIVKRGMFEAGISVSQLTTHSHGFQSDTWFGQACLNPIKTSVESRYVRERLIMRPRERGPAVRALIQRLTSNGVVAINAVHTGRRYGVREFFGGTIRVAKGAANIAVSTDATLIPVFILPVQDGFELRLESPLTCASSSIDNAEEELVSNYVECLRPYVSQYPYLWRGWFDASTYWQPSFRANGLRSYKEE